jgi:hypothetical protein
MDGLLGAFVSWVNGTTPVRVEPGMATVWKVQELDRCRLFDGAFVVYDRPAGSFARSLAELSNGPACRQRFSFGTRPRSFERTRRVRVCNSWSPAVRGSRCIGISRRLPGTPAERMSSSCSQRRFLNRRVSFSKEVTRDYGDCTQSINRSSGERTEGDRPLALELG